MGRSLLACLIPTPAAGRGPGALIAWGRLGYPCARHGSGRRVADRRHELARRPHRAPRRRALHGGRGRGRGRRRRHRRARHEHPSGSSERRSPPPALVSATPRPRSAASADRSAIAIASSRSWIWALTSARNACPAYGMSVAPRAAAGRGPLLRTNDNPSRQAPFAGSFAAAPRRVLALRTHTDSVEQLDAARVRIAASTGSPMSTARQPLSPLNGLRAPDRRCREEVAQEVVPAGREDRLGMELHAFDRKVAMAQPHHQPVFRLGGDLEHRRYRIARHDERVVPRRRRGWEGRRTRRAPV